MSLDTVLLRDEFSDDRAAGSVNGTFATDGTVRSVADADGDKLWLSGALELRSLTSPQFGNPTIRYPVSMSRSTFPIVLSKFYQSGVGGIAFVGFFNAYSGAIGGGNVPNCAYLQATSLTLYEKATKAINFPLPGGGCEYEVAVIARSSGGAAYMVRGGAYTHWVIAYISNASVDATLYAGISALNSSCNRSFDYIRASYGYMPTPIGSDGFSNLGISDGLGHAETSGVGSGGSGVSWSNVGGGWSVSGGKAINTPSTGGELLADGDMEIAGVANWTDVGTPTTKAKSSSIVHGGTQSLHIISSGNFNGAQTTLSAVAGKWYKVSGWLYAASGDAQILCSIAGGTANKVHSSASWSQFLAVIRETTTTTRQIICRCQATLPSDQYYDDISVVELALSSLLSLHASSTPDVFAGIDLTVTTGTQSGLALNWDSSSSPANGVIAYHDGTNCKLEKCVAGVWTTVVSAAATYSANARIVVSKIGTAYRLYYNNALVGSGTISDAGIINNTLHGLFSTDSSNTLDNYTCYASGTGGEYATAFDIVVPASGQSNGAGAATAAGTAKRLASGQSNGAGAATGAISVRRNVSGQSNGIGAATGIVVAKRLASGQSNGTGTATIHNYTVSATISS